ncbi:hypothetical protein LSPH24S_06825 [Lysinibacillus sphaericus]
MIYDVIIVGAGSMRLYEQEIARPGSMFGHNENMNS